MTSKTELHRLIHRMLVLIPAVTLITLIIQLDSCTSTPESRSNNNTTLSYPLPDPVIEIDGEETQLIQYNEETGFVEVPLWYWLELTRYINYTYGK